MASKEAKSLTEILKDIAKEQGAEVITYDIEDLSEYGTLSLGSPGLDFCTYNSFPEKAIIEISGPEGSGKSSLADMICASFQKKEIKRNPTEPRKILYVDLEFRKQPSWAKKMGFDMKTNPVKTLVYRPEDKPAEKIFDDIIAMVRTGEIGIVVIDSLNMLVGQQTQAESLTQKQMGGIAGALGDFVKRITSLLYKYNCTLIGINQLRDGLNPYGPAEVTSGGRAWKHACSLRLRVKKGKFISDDGEELSNNAESPAGYIMEVAVLKTSVCKWDRKLGRTVINFDRGVDILQDTIDVATYFNIIQNPVPGSFLVVDPDTGVSINDAEGNPVKIRGKKNLKPFFEEHLDLWHKIYDKVYEKLSVKDDPNIISFERMLQVNVAEAFGVDFTKEQE